MVLARNTNGVLLNSVMSDFLPDRNEIEIFGQNYILRISLHRFDGLELSPLHSYEGDLQSRIKNAMRFMKELPQAIIQSRYGGDLRASFRAEWKHFIDCIRQDKPLECTLEDGRRALQVALAALKAASSGEPVKVAEAPRNTTVPSRIS
jgi:predicted dehydrogenase